MMSTDYTFCPKCGGQLTSRFVEGRTRQVCRSCGFIFYRNPIPAAGVIIVEDNRVLLVRRKHAPGAGDWCLPSGFVEWDESAEQCAIRETKEETNLEVAITKLFGVFPAGDHPEYKILVVFYYARVCGGELQAGDDAIDARFFLLNELPSNIAFQVHRKILQALRDEDNWIDRPNGRHDNVILECR